MSEQVLLLGGPKHLAVWRIDEIHPYLRFAEREPSLPTVFDIDSPITLTRPKVIVYQLHRWRWSDGSILHVYSCVDDEYWMRPHVLAMGDQLRRLSPWFGPGRLDLAAEFEKLWREVDAKLQNSSYAQNRSYAGMHQLSLKFDRLKRQLLGGNE